LGLKRGEIWWATLPPPLGSEPGGRRPVLIVSSDDYNDSAIKTVVVVGLTTNLKLANIPGNVYVTPEETGLAKEAVVNITQITATDKTFLTEKVSALHPDAFELVKYGLSLLLPS
jgi:mRNA interferase MazF